MYIATYITYYSWHIRICNAYTNFKYTISTNGIKIIYNKVKIIPISTILFNILQLIFFI